MLGTWLNSLSAAAVVLLVLATAAMMGVSRSPHKAPPRGRQRRLRVAVAATTVACGAMPVAAVAGTGPTGAVAVAGVLAVAVLVTAPSRGGWAVRGVVVRSLAVTFVAASLLWLAHRAVSFGPDVPLLGLLTLLLGISATAGLRLLPVLDGWVEHRAALDSPAPAPVPRSRLARPVTVRTGGAALTVGALVLPAAAVAAVTVVSTDEPAASGATDRSQRDVPPTRTTPSATSRTGSPVPSRPGSRAPSADPSAAPPTARGAVAEPAGGLVTATTPRATPAPQTAGPKSPDGSSSPTSTGTPAEPSPSESSSAPGVPRLIPWPTGEPEETSSPGSAGGGKG